MTTDPFAEINTEGVALQHVTNHRNNYNNFKLQILGVNYLMEELYNRTNMVKFCLENQRISKIFYCIPYQWKNILITALSMYT